MKAVLTGASGGIGHELFKAMSDMGFDVACCSRSKPKELLRLVEEKNEQGSHHDVFNLDLESDESIENCLKEIEFWGGKRIDVLVNCAGIPYGGLINMTKMDDLRQVFQVNFFGQIMMTQKISRYIAKNGGGRIVNIASNAGLRADKGTLAYGSSKAAMIHATRIMAAEYAVNNIAVNAVAPSVIETDMASEMDPKVTQKILNLTNIDRLVAVEEVVKIVVFLVGEAPLALTGEVLKVDGCMSL